MVPSWHPMESMEMKFLTKSELLIILQRHYRRHIDTADFLDTPGVGSVLQVAFSDDNKKNDNFDRQISG